ncbi:MAG: low-specificity L-threonine aldolase [Clostridiaceae bacterium]
MNKPKYLDFRSDTVTRPTENMYKAIMEAQLGDDVYGDDPTINELERLSAEITGKEAAMFVPTGTFGNQVSIMTHIKPGDEVITGSGAHIIMHECGSASKLSGAMIREVEDVNGYMRPMDIEKKIRKTEDIHFPKTGLITLENAHSNGLVIPMEILKETKELADKYSIPVHIDGARLFNAASYLKIDVKEIAKYCDSLTFCLSKGLCAPVGSVVCGTKEFIEKARRNRKSMGGGMRQAGILAAAGIVGLNEMRERLSEDYENAVFLGEQLRPLDELEVFESNIQINMVFVSHVGTDDSIMDELPEYLQNKGILVNPHEDGIMRFVTNYWTDREACKYLADSIKAFFAEKRA